MTTRRSFITGLLGTAMAPVIPMPLPLDDFTTAPIPYRVFLPARIYAMGHVIPRYVRWTDQEDHNDWSPA